MSRNSWFKFYPNDWLSDPNLKLCSYEAKGIWMDLICYAHNSEKYGFLVINSKNFDKKMIKKVLNLKKSGIKSFLELIENGVIGIAEDGAFYSRRLLKEKKLADESREHGRKGGNPKLLKRGVKGKVIPEVRDKSKEIRDKSNTSIYPFNNFYNAGLLKQNPGKCEKLFNSLFFKFNTFFIIFLSKFLEFITKKPYFSEL